MRESSFPMEWTIWTYAALWFGIFMIVAIIIGFIWEHKEKKKVEEIVKQAEKNDELNRRLPDSD